MPTTKNTNAWKLFCNEFNTTGDNPEIKLHPTPQDHRTTKAIIRHYYHLRSPWAMRANGKCVHTIGGEVIPFVGHHKFQGKINHKWRCNCWKCFKLVTNLKPFFVCNAPHTVFCRISNKKKWCNLISWIYTEKSLPRLCKIVTLYPFIYKSEFLVWNFFF